MFEHFFDFLSHKFPKRIICVPLELNLNDYVGFYDLKCGNLSKDNNDYLINSVTIEQAIMLINAAITIQRTLCILGGNLLNYIPFDQKGEITKQISGDKRPSFHRMDIGYGNGEQCLLMNSWDRRDISVIHSLPQLIRLFANNTDEVLKSSTKIQFAIFMDTDTDIKSELYNITHYKYSGARTLLNDVTRVTEMFLSNYPDFQSRMGRLPIIYNGERDPFSELNHILGIENELPLLFDNPLIELDKMDTEYEKLITLGQKIFEEQEKLQILKEEEELQKILKEEEDFVEEEEKFLKEEEELSGLSIELKFKILSLNAEIKIKGYTKKNIDEYNKIIQSMHLIKERIIYYQRYFDELYSISSNYRLSSVTEKFDNIKKDFEENNKEIYKLKPPSEVLSLISSSSKKSNKKSNKLKKKGGSKLKRRTKKYKRKY